MEPDRADCVLQSIKSKKLKKIKIKNESIMGGMSCNEMSLVPWKILKKATNSDLLLFLVIGNYSVKNPSLREIQIT